MEILSSVCYLSNTGWPDDDVSGSQWTPAENKAFENALAYFDEKMPDRWYKMAAMVPTKTLLDIIIHYKKLEFDVTSIEAGLVKIPRYSSAASSSYVRKTCVRSASEQECKKGILWTEEEHKLFLMGLKKYGKGDWRNISRNFVVTRTPTQFASHAQKYFNRQLSGGKDKRRASIHDITTVNLNENQLQGFFRHERNVSETIWCMKRSEFGFA